MNIGHIYEIQGHHIKARETYISALLKFSSQEASDSVELHIPSYIHIRLATLLPRIAKHSKDIVDSRSRFVNDLRVLLGSNTDANVSSSNFIIRIPSHQTTDANIRTNRHFLCENESKSMSPDDRSVICYVRIKLLSPIDNLQPLSFGFSTGYYLLYQLPSQESNDCEKDHQPNNLQSKRLLYQLYSRYCPSLSHGRFAGRIDPLPVTSSAVTRQNPEFESVMMLSDGDISDSPKNSEVIRLGLISRNFIANHPVGLFSAGLFDVFRDNQTIISPQRSIEIHVFTINPKEIVHDDLIWQSIVSKADKVHYIPSDIDTIVRTIKKQALDLLIYMDIGHDPVTYFAAFNHAARKQMAWHIGHPETTGQPFDPTLLLRL